MLQSVKQAAASVLPRNVLGRLSAAKRAFSYPGEWLWPRSAFGAKAHFVTARAAGAGIARERELVARELQNVDSRRIEEDDGFGRFDFSDSPALRACAESARSLEKSLDFEALTNKAKKKFLVQRQIRLEDLETAPIMRFGVDLNLISIISAYLKSVPVLADVRLWYSPNTTMEGRSQLFHLDNEDIRQIKCFVPVRDVEIENGPTWILPASATRFVFSSMDRDGFRYDIGQKFDDEAIVKRTQSEPVPLTGKVGDVLLADTSRCLHYGSRPATKPRMLLSFLYFSAFSRSMPWRFECHTPPDYLPQGSELQRKVNELVLGPMPACYETKFG